MIQNQLWTPCRSHSGRLSVIVPALNESETIAAVVSFARRSPLVDDIIVVDDGSIDGTPELATAAGARVITSTMLGKGASMEDGLREAKNELILYLDGDLQGLAEDLIEKMAHPLLTGEADFVKAKFNRPGGRVTTLTAKPLLKTYFPDLARFDQPLSGIMAARRSLLEDLQFENDYGVDVGLLIDAACAKAQLVEVDIGELQHDSQPLDLLGEMATQVARAILGRAAVWGRLRHSYMQEVFEVERHTNADLGGFFDRIGNVERAALFDMDGTLLKGRFIVELAKRTDREEGLKRFLDHFELSPEERTRQIAKLFAGVERAVFEEVAMKIPLMDGAIDAVVGLRKAGFHVGIVTDSYQIAAEIVRRRVFADFSFANLMRFKRGKASGNVTLSPAMYHPAGCPEHEFCKSNVIPHLLEKLAITPEDMLSVGDGLNDVCLLKATGRSVAFQPKARETAEAAQEVVTSSLVEVLTLI
jgi:glucosyl-3-phosphoglycerate synthase